MLLLDGDTTSITSRTNRRPGESDHQLGDDPLMPDAGRRGHKQASIDDLVAEAVVRQVQQVFECPGPTRVGTLRVSRATDTSWLGGSEPSQGACAIG